MATLFMTGYTTTGACSENSIKDSVEIEDDPMNDDGIGIDDLRDDDDKNVTTVGSSSSSSDTASDEEEEEDFVIVDKPNHHSGVDESIEVNDRIRTKAFTEAKLPRPIVSTMVLPRIETSQSCNEIETTDLDDAFDEANQSEKGEDDDLFIPAQQSSVDRSMDNGDEERTACRIKDSMTPTAVSTSNHCNVRNCVSPVMNDSSSMDNSSHRQGYENDDDDDLTAVYSTPMSSPIYSNSTSTNTSTAIVVWSLQNQPLTTWNESGTSSCNIIASNVPYHGLCNLGNTCYMASALQMLGSIPSFTDLVRNEIPSVPSIDTNLRIAFLSLMDQLSEAKCSENETNDVCSISPQSLKNAIDDRTSLFAGYRQHDAHEFITTILDLLDEDYKQKMAKNSDDITLAGTFTKAEEPMDVVFDSQNDDVKNAGDMEDDSCDELILERSSGVNDTVYCPETSSKAKKQKMDESIKMPTMDTESGSDEAMSSSMTSKLDDGSCRSSSCPQSYSELDMDAIERLIHGGDTSNQSSTTDMMLYDGTTSGDGLDNRQSSHHHQQEQHSTDCCKLVGGRMSTNDIVLTPYGNDERNESISSLRFPSLFHGNHMMQPSQTHPATAVHRDTGSINDAMVDSDNENEGNTNTETVIPSPIDTTFTTEVRVRLTCDSCKFTRSHKETYLHLSLEIGSSTASEDFCSMGGASSNSIEDGIRRFFSPCTQELKCEKCFCETATQCTEITKLPPVLLLHLKRFIVDYSPDWTSISYHKNQTAVYLNEDLSVYDDSGALLEFLASDCRINKPLAFATGVNTSSSSLQSNTSKYILRSVVNHIGSSANCGHYTVDAQRGPQNEWFRFNDTYVSSLSNTEVIDQSKQTAYMCLYELV